MARYSKSQISNLFTQYAYHRLCDEYDAEGKSNSLQILYRLANTDTTAFKHMPRAEQFNRLYPKIDKSVAGKISVLEAAMNNLYKLTENALDDTPLYDQNLETDSRFDEIENPELIEKTLGYFEHSLSYFKSNDIQTTKTRNAIYDNIYDLAEKIYPSGSSKQFETIRNMVRGIKKNDGTFDHNPLNISAKRIQFFMNGIPAEKRYMLLLEISQKTFSKSYNYDSQLAGLFNDYKKEQLQKKEARRLTNQERYEIIRGKELPSAENNQTKIKLYSELLNLVNDQDWGRGRKFGEKKTILNHLISLYRAEGMTTEMHRAMIKRDRYLNAGKICKEASRRRGYNSRG